MRLALIYIDEVSDQVSLVACAQVHDDVEGDEHTKLNDLLTAAINHSIDAQPRYGFDFSKFMDIRRAFSEDEDYKYEVVTIYL